jgi:uncharacterized membrane protein YedE/YeeE
VIASALVAGVVFGVGLVISGMSDPRNIIGFLDVAGDWNPALALVMAAAIAVHAPVVAAVRRRRAPLFDDRFHWPTAIAIDARLVAGAAIFGVGWGLSGYCPGPALVATGSGEASVLVFVACLVVGHAIASAIIDR